MVVASDILAATPPAAGFTRRPRDRELGIHQFQLHSTQGPVPLGLQVAATMNWFGNTRPFPQGNDKGGWGGSADFVVGPYQGGPLKIFKFGDWVNTHSTWSAGYGARGPAQEYGASEVGIAIEIAQEAMPGQPLGDYSLELVDLVAQLMSYCNGVLQGLGRPPIPNVRIAHWDQRRGAQIPRGLIGHEDLENGRKLGKQDPGRNFPWPYLQHRFQTWEDKRHDVSPAPPEVETIPVPRATLLEWRDELSTLLGE